MTPYQFSVLRYVHSATSGEFVNVGVLLWSPSDRRVRFRVSERYARLSAFFQGFDGPGYRQLIRHLTRRFANEDRLFSGLREQADDITDVMHPLVPEDGSVFQWSEIMAGIADQPDARFDQLYKELVERFEVVGPRSRKDEVEIMNTVESRLAARGVLPRLKSGVELESPHYTYRFRLGWNNGQAQVLEPISFDYLSPGDVVEKANTWSGRLLNLSHGSARFAMTGVVAPPSRRDLAGAFDRAVQILSEAPSVRRIVIEDEFDAFIPEIERDLAH